MNTHVTDTPPTSAQASTQTTADESPSPDSNLIPDRELLRRYVRSQDEAAFAELVRRHSRLVMGVCRRVLRSEQDIEDAFQATFLVLARDARRIRRSDAVVSWLHGVAYRTSLRAADSTRRRGRLLREITMIEDSIHNDTDDGPLAQVEQRHQQQALDEELASLPDNYRAALVLHYLDGKSNQQVADELGLTVTAVEGRLKRGKKELRLRLARRGIGLSVAVAAMQAVASTAQAMPLEPLIARAIDAGLSYAGGEAAGPVYSPEVARLAGQELMTMSTTTAATLAAVILLPLTLGFAGHDAIPGPAASQAIINTTLAQAIPSETEEKVSQASATEIVEEQIVLPNVTDFDVITTGDGRNVIITYEQDGKRHRKVIRLEEGKTTDSDTVMGFRRLDFDKESPTETAERPSDDEGLDKRVSLNFKYAPLSKAVQEISTVTGRNIVIDSPALRDVGVDVDTPVTINVEKTTLRYALNNLLRPLNLGWYEKDEVLVVTSLARLKRDLAEEAMLGGQQGPARSTLDLQVSPESGVLDYAKIPPSEIRIQEALHQPTQVEFVDTPLGDALNFIATLHRIPILIDEAALTDIGIPTDEPVNLILNGVQLQSVLDLMLGKIGCTTILRDEVLQVTTVEIADTLFETRVYNIRNLGPLAGGSLAKILETAIPDAKWRGEKEDSPGGTVAEVDGALVVMQTQAVHNRIVDLLNQLHRHAEISPQSETSQNADLRSTGTVPRRSSASSSNR